MEGQEKDDVIKEILRDGRVKGNDEVVDDCGLIKDIEIKSRS